MNYALVFTLFLLFASSEVVNYSDSVMARIYQFHLDALIIFQSDEILQSSVQSAIKQFAETSLQLTIILLAKSQNEKLFAKVSHYYGINLSSEPQILYLSKQKKKYRFQSNNITAGNIASFIYAAKNGSVPPYYKSEAITQSDHSLIKQVVGKSFKQIVLDAQKQVLVYFYGAKCARCIHFAPHFQLLASRFGNNSNIVFAKFDATANEVDGLSIQTLPIVKFWRKDKSSPLQYTGKYTFEYLLEWIKQIAQYPWIQLNYTIDQTV